MKLQALTTAVVAAAIQLIPGAAAHAQQYVPPGFCGGSFADPQVVNGYLEWGASETCNASGGGSAFYYPHSIEVELYLGTIAVRTIRSAAYDNHNATITAYSQNDQCRTTAPTTYSMIAHAAAGSTSATYQSNDHTVNCNIG